MNQPGKVALPARDQLVRESEFSPVLVNGSIRVVRITMCIYVRGARHRNFPQETADYAN